MSWQKTMTGGYSLTHNSCRKNSSASSGWAASADMECTKWKASAKNTGKRFFHAPQASLQLWLHPWVEETALLPSYHLPPAQEKIHSNPCAHTCAASPRAGRENKARRDTRLLRPRRSGFSTGGGGQRPGLPGSGSGPSACGALGHQGRPATLCGTAAGTPATRLQMETRSA